MTPWNLKHKIRTLLVFNVIDEWNLCTWSSVKWSMFLTNDSLFPKNFVSHRVLFLYFSSLMTDSLVNIFWACRLLLLRIIYYNIFLLVTLLKMFALKKCIQQWRIGDFCTLTIFTTTTMSLFDDFERKKLSHFNNISRVYWRCKKKNVLKRKKINGNTICRQIFTFFYKQQKIVFWLLKCLY